MIKHEIEKQMIDSMLQDMFADDKRPRESCQRIKEDVMSGRRYRIIVENIKELLGRELYNLRHNKKHNCGDNPICQQCIVNKAVETDKKGTLDYISDLETMLMLNDEKYG